MNMKVSEKGLDLIRKFEGLRLESYRCPANVLTVGYGHTGPDVQEGMTITEEQANDLLWRDVRVAERCVNGAVTVPLTQGEFDALCSFVYSVGCARFRNSSLLRRLLDSDYDRAADEILRWVYADGKKLNGLLARREAEKERFEEAA